MLKRKKKKIMERKRKSWKERENHGKKEKIMERKRKSWKERVRKRKRCSREPNLVLL